MIRIPGQGRHVPTFVPRSIPASYQATLAAIQISAFLLAPK